MLGPKIAKLRRERNITDTELAQLVGVPKETITLWESGFSTPNKAQIKRLASVFQVMPDELCQDDYSGARTVNNSGVRTINNSSFRTVNNTSLPNEQAAKIVKVFAIFMIISVFSSVISFFFSFMEEREDIEQTIRDININVIPHEDDEVFEEHIICEFGEEERELVLRYYESDGAIADVSGDVSLLTKNINSYVDVQDVINHVKTHAHSDGGTCRLDGPIDDAE